MLLFSALSALLPLQAVTAAATSDKYHRFEEVHAPQNWVAQSPAAPDIRLDVKIYLARQNVAGFEKNLIEISTPGATSYGNHLSKDAIREMLRPSERAINSVTHWIKQHGCGDKLRVEGDRVHVTGSVRQLEALLSTKYHIFKNVETGERKIRTLSYSLPKSLHEHISMIHPTTRIGGPEPSRSTIKYIEPIPGQQGKVESLVSGSAIDPACNSSITPACLRELYSFGGYEPAEDLSTIGIGGFLEQWAQYSDLNAFLAKYDPTNADGNFSIGLINGGVNTQTNTTNAGEADLDIEYAVGISRTVPVTYYSTGGRPPIVGNGTNDNEPYLEFLQYFLDLEDAELPRTLSISYGESEQSVPPSYASTVCGLFAQLGARGVSILTASGDGGPGGSCKSNDGNNTTMFTPLFPAGCPYVTAVGATHYVEPEAAVSFSGGGFSNHWARPSYQDSVVQAYLDAGYSDEYAQYFNQSGRAIPDVAAQGSNFHVIYHGSDVGIGGTSASTPAFASIINLVNNELLVQGKKPLGFLNPWLYSKGKDALTDITAGTSTGCSAVLPGAGFPAVEGWDAVTGLGTPVFTKLLEAAGASY